MKIDVAGHRVVVTHADMSDGILFDAWDAIKRAPQENFDRYDNPFEGKWTLKREFKTADKSTIITRVIGRLENEIVRAREWFDAPSLQVDTQRHYCSVFRYRSGDHLSVHMDAGIHPLNGLRKHVTALLYLGDIDGGELELWQADKEYAYTAEEKVASIGTEHGMLVMFENNDDAWHGMTPYFGDKPRIVVTVSFLSEEVDRWENKRTRAYFIPRWHEDWSRETFELRDQRCDPERFAGAYQTAVKM